MFGIEFDPEGGEENQTSAWKIKYNGMTKVLVDCKFFGQIWTDDSNYDQDGAKKVALICFEALKEKWVG